MLKMLYITNNMLGFVVENWMYSMLKEIERHLVKCELVKILDHTLVGVDQVVMEDPEVQEVVVVVEGPEVEVDQTPHQGEEEEALHVQYLVVHVAEVSQKVLLEGLDLQYKSLNEATVALDQDHNQDQLHLLVIKINEGYITKIYCVIVLTVVLVDCIYLLYYLAI